MPASLGLWGGLNCLLGRHVRSRGQARATADGFVGRCARCAVPMARSHGGGSWQVVKTPKAGKADAKAERILAKAIARSRKAAARSEEKAVKLAIQNGMPLPPVRVALGEDGEPLPTPKRRLLRRKRAGEGVEAKRRRRLLVFRRKPDADGEGEPGDPTVATAAAQDADEAPEPKRGLLGRRRRPKVDARPELSLAQEVAAGMDESKLSLSGRKKAKRSLAQDVADDVVQPKRRLLGRKRAQRAEAASED